MASCVLKPACRGALQGLFSCLWLKQFRLPVFSFIGRRSMFPARTELPRCEGDAWWPVAFSNLLVEEHSRGYTHAPLAEVIAASVLLFYWQVWYQGQCGQSSQDVKVVLGGQLRSQTCL